MYREYRYLPIGDRGLVIEVSDKIEEKANRVIRNLMEKIAQHFAEEIVEMVPTYRSLMVIYDPLKISFANLVLRVKKLVTPSNTELIIDQPEVIEIPVLYGDEYGPDLKFVARYNNLTVEEVIEIHSEKKYLIYMLGFTPGFPYLGGMSAKIATPRLDTPRPVIKAGSVGIAGNQTGIYPIDSPGGWRIIGRTPLKLFQADRKPPFLLRPGNYLKFVPITLEKFKELSQE